VGGAVLTKAESERKPLIRMVNDKPQQTDQESAETCQVPNPAGHPWQPGDRSHRKRPHPVLEAV